MPVCGIERVNHAMAHMPGMVLVMRNGPTILLSERRLGRVVQRIPYNQHMGIHLPYGELVHSQNR